MSDDETSPGASLCGDDQFLDDMVAMYDFWPPIAARMFGSLILADGSYLSSRQLMERLHASSGSVSTMGRLLIERGYVERTVDPETRRDLFRLRPSVWMKFQHDSVRRFEQLIAMCDRVIEARFNAGRPPVANLQDMRDYFGFVSKELPLLMSRLEERQAKCAEERVMQRSIPLDDDLPPP